MRTHRPGRWGASRAAASRGFTLVEVSVTIIIIAVLAGIFLVAVGHGAIFARESAERQNLVAMKQAVISFQNDFRFLPPLVKDTMPTRLVNGATQPNTYMGAGLTTQQFDDDRAYLQGYTSASGGNVISPDRRFSEFSLQYFLMGALDYAPTNNKPIDGAAGPAFTKPNEDGTFQQRGTTHEAYMDFGKGGRGVRQSETNLVYMDRWQTPIRYYRWIPRANKANGKPEIWIPRCVGDPLKNPALGNAEFALVSLGANKRTDELRPRAVGDTGAVNPAINPDLNDDIVEVGP